MVSAARLENAWISISVRCCDWLRCVILERYSLPRSECLPTVSHRTASLCKGCWRPATLAVVPIWLIFAHNRCSRAANLAGAREGAHGARAGRGAGAASTAHEASGPLVLPPRAASLMIIPRRVDVALRGPPIARSVLGGPRTAVARLLPAIARHAHVLRARRNERTAFRENWRRASRREATRGSCTPLWLGWRPSRAIRGVWRTHCSIS